MTDPALACHDEGRSSWTADGKLHEPDSAGEPHFQLGEIKKLKISH